MDWILDLLTPLATIRNYRAIADLQALQFTTEPAKPFPACRALTSISLATASNSAIAQAVSRWLPTAAARGSSPGLVLWDLW
jgi:hypothetical protein